MFDFDALKKDVAAAAARTANDKAVSRAIPEGWGRVVAFNKDGRLLGRMNLPLEQALSKFQATVRGDVPTDYGYSLLYAWDRPATRVGYHTYKGVCQVEIDHLKALLSPNAEGKGRKAPKRLATKPPVAEPPAVVESDEETAF